MIDLYPDPSAAKDGNIDAVCQTIRDATKGFGTDETKLLQAMGRMDAATRWLVPTYYAQKFDDTPSLPKMIQSECGSRDFGTALQLLAYSPIQAEVHMIDKAVEGFGTNEMLLYSILCGRTNQEMLALKQEYFHIHERDMAVRLAQDLGGNLEQLITNCLQCNEEAYDPSYHNEGKMEDDMDMLYKMGQGKFGTNEKGLFKFLCLSPTEYLKPLNMMYADKYGFTLWKALETEMGGQLRDAALFLIGMKLKPYEEVAKLIERACKGFGTNELLLTCTLIRYQRHLPQVNEAFIKLYGTTVRDRVEGEVGKLYRKLLMEVMSTGGI